MKYLVFNATDGIYASPKIMTKEEAELFIQNFRANYVEQGYYFTVTGDRIPPEEVELVMEEAPEEHVEQDVTLLPHIIVTGNPGEGFEFYGPFPNFITAANHAENDGDLRDHDWWIAPLHSVEVK